MKTTQPIHIGIIGGMGPQASALLHTLIVNACTRDLNIRECHEFPLITHVSIPAIDFISNPELRSLNNGLLKRAVQALQTTKLDIAVIACNTAHLLIEELAELQGLPLITLPGSVLRQASKEGVERLGLIASPTTLQMRLYEKYADEHGIELILPEGDDRKRAERIIRATIAGRAGQKEALELHAIADELRQRGAEKVALGCTELSVVMSNENDSRLIDSLTATTNNVVEAMRLRTQELIHV